MLRDRSPLLLAGKISNMVGELQSDMGAQFSSTQPLEVAAQRARGRLGWNFPE